MAINAKEIIYASDINKIFRDIDSIGMNIMPINWKSTQSFTTSTIDSVCYGDGKFVAGGASGIMAYSTDGKNWTAISQSFTTSTINSIYYSNGKFIAVGYSGKIGYFQVFTAIFL